MARSSTKATRDYQVGRGKPPTHSQFRPGESGNPRGRPPGSKSLATLLEDELKQKVVVKENGREVTVTKLELAVKQAVNKLAAGDPRIYLMLVKHVHLLAAESNPAAKDEIFSSEDDEAALLTWMQTMKKEGSS